MDNGNCSDTCVNDIPYHHCECDDGDELDPSGLTCIHNVECSGDGSNFTCSCLPGYADTTTNNSYNCTGIYHYSDMTTCHCTVLQTSTSVKVDQTVSVETIHTVTTSMETTHVYVILDTILLEPAAVSLSVCVSTMVV